MFYYIVRRAIFLFGIEPGARLAVRAIDQSLHYFWLKITKKHVYHNFVRAIQR